MSRLPEKVAIATGASKGIGAGIATALGAAGARVAVNYSSDQQGAERLAQAIIDSGGEAIAVGADASKAADVARLFKEVHSAFGRLDVLVNNAGVFRFGAFAEITEESFHLHYNINVPHFAGGIVPGDGIFTTWSYRAGAGRAEAFLLNPQPLTARTAYEWGVVSEVVPNGKALSRARELAELHLKAPEVTRRNTRVHFMQPLKERIVREVGYGMSLEGASAADLVKSMQAKSEPVARKGKSA